MRLWIERYAYSGKRLYTRVSLVWGCELKDDMILYCLKHCMVSLVWGCELKDVDDVKNPMERLGQPRMRLWIERIMLLFLLLWHLVSLVWGCELKDSVAGSSTSGDFWSASYEAVNWKTASSYRRNQAGTVSLVWGCELKEHFLSVKEMEHWSASYEAVNWKTN